MYTPSQSFRKGRDKFTKKWIIYFIFIIKRKRHNKISASILAFLRLIFLDPAKAQCVSVWSVECAENAMMTRERRLMQRALLPSQPGPAPPTPGITTDLKYFLSTHHTGITNPQNWSDNKIQWSQEPVTHWREYDITNINDFNLAAFAPNGFDYYVCKMLQSIRVLCRHPVLDLG